MKPLAFIDVDGVLNRVTTATDASKRGLVKFEATFTLWMDPVDKYRLELLEDYFELAWGTTWEDHANEMIAPFLGLPNYPIVAKVGYGDSNSKVPGVVRAANGRPFVWFDDMGFMRHELENNHGLYGVPWNLIEIDPYEGLTDAHIAEAIAWAKALDSNG